jgi:hypothetical protein
MATNLIDSLAEHSLRRDLVSISRDEIDDKSIQGYVLALSAELVVVQFVYDFHLDGLKVLRIADITAVDCSTTDRFHKELLAREGLEQAVPFDKAFDANDWRSIIGQLARDFPLMILECESLNEKDFAIGRVNTLSETTVDFEYFSGVADWNADLTEFDLSDVTSCQVDTNYINVYRRHFERLALS